MKSTGKVCCLCGEVFFGAGGEANMRLTGGGGRVFGIHSKHLLIIPFCSENRVENCRTKIINIIHFPGEYFSYKI